MSNVMCPFCREGRNHAHWIAGRQHAVEHGLIARTALNDEMDAWRARANAPLQLDQMALFAILVTKWLIGKSVCHFEAEEGCSCHLCNPFYWRPNHVNKLRDLADMLDPYREWRV